MSAFGGLILTNRGRILQSKAQTGIELKYTRIALGDGNLGSSSVLDLNALRHEVKSLTISKLKVLGEGRAVVGAVLRNQDLTSGFFMREIGVFATDPDVGEILYCYGNAGDLAEYIPAGGTDTIEKSIDVQTLIGNAANVTAVLDSLIFESPEGAQAKVDVHSADYVKHPGTATTTNAANVYSVTLNPAPTSYIDKMGVVITVNANSTGACTINVNGLGAKAIKNDDGTDFTDFKKDGIYTLRYNAETGNFILQGKGGGLSLSQKTSLVNAVNTLEAESNTTLQTSLNNIRSSIISKGGVVPTNPALADIKTAVDNVATWDGDLIPANIKQGVNVLGVNGTMPVGKQYVTLAQSNTASFPHTGTHNFVFNLPFIPKLVASKRYGWTYVDGSMVTSPGTGDNFYVSSMTVSGSTVTVTLTNNSGSAYAIGQFGLTIYAYD